MDFHAEFFPKAFPKKISHKQNLLLVGSCFTEQIGNKLKQHKFSVLDNPNGILFNPVSISNAVISYVEERVYAADDLFYHNEIWGSWQHHTRFSNTSREKALEAINASQHKAAAFLKTADWILITLGSAFVYEQTALQDGGHRHIGECRALAPAWENMDAKARERLQDGDCALAEWDAVLLADLHAARRNRPDACL